MHEALLRLDRLTKLYPGTIALRNASLDLEPGDVHGIIGKNGAGKTTLVKIISGIETPTSGALSVRGVPHAGWTRAQARENGVAIVAQEPQIVPDFTVAENLFTPDYPRTPLGRIDWPGIYRRAEAVLSEAGIRVSARARGSDLTISEQQLVLVAKAFFVDSAEILLLDEVTASLSEKDEALLDGLIKGQKARGRAIIYITHRMAEIMRLCDRVSVLRDGRIVATERVADLTESRLSEYITGGAQAADVASIAPQRAPGTPPLLRVEGLAIPGRYEGISFDLQEGEILGLAGLRGCGRTEIMKSLVGILRPQTGSVLLDGKDAFVSGPDDALRRGIVYLPEDRDREGLVEVHGVRLNLSLSSLGAILTGPFLDRGKEDRRAAELIRTLSIETPSAEQEVRYLSGGNKQKVVVGRILSTRPRLYLLDEPTKGIDIAAKRGILDMARTRLRKAAGVIITAPGLDDLMETCDRILVLHRGRIAAEFARQQFDEPAIYMAMQGLGRHP